MEMLDTIFGGEMSTTTQLVLITIVVLIGLFLVYWLYRRIAGSTKLMASRKRQPRLAVLDAAYVDDKRRLILIRRDNVEHLVLIGGPTDVAIETNIQRPRTTASSSQPPASDVHSPTGTQYQPEPAPAIKPAKETNPLSASTPQAIAAAAVGAATANRQRDAAPEQHNPPTQTPEATTFANSTQTMASVSEEIQQIPESDFVEAGAANAVVEPDNSKNPEVHAPEPVLVEPVRQFEPHSNGPSSTPGEPSVETPKIEPEPVVTAESDLSNNSSEPEPIALPDETTQTFADPTAELTNSISDNLSGGMPSVSESMLDSSNTDRQFEEDLPSTERQDPIGADMPGSEPASAEALEMDDTLSYIEPSSPSARHVETVESVSLEPGSEEAELDENELTEPILPEPIMPEKPAVTTDEIRVAAASVTEKIGQIIGDSPSSDTEPDIGKRAVMEHDLAASIDGPAQPENVSESATHPDFTNGVDAPPIASDHGPLDHPESTRIENSEDEMKRLLNELSGDKVN